MGTCLQHSLDFCLAWALIGERTSRVLFPVPKGPWPRHGHAGALLQNYKCLLDFVRCADPSNWTMICGSPPVAGTSTSPLTSSRQAVTHIWYSPQEHVSRSWTLLSMLVPVRSSSLRADKMGDCSGRTATCSF